MPDEVYQPKRVPINPDIVDTPETNEAPDLPQIDVEQPNMRPLQADVEQPTMRPLQPEGQPTMRPLQGEGGMELKGNIPPQFQNALSKERKAKREQAKEVVTTSETAVVPPAVSREVQPSIPPGTVRTLEQLIHGIQTKSTLYEEITLPSKGIFYDGDDGPQDGVIHVRPMTGEEEQILATPRFVKKGQAINMIFDRCMQENFNSERFITPDRTYMLIFLRGISYTPSYDVEVKCPHCDRKFATVIDLNDLYVESCPENFSSSNLKDSLPTTGYNFSYRLSTGTDEQRVQAHRDRKLRGGFETSGQADDTLLYRTAIMIEEVEGLADKEELQALLKKLPINDVAYLRTVVNDPPFGVDTKVEIPCPGCLEDFEIELPLESNFFFPRGRKKTPNTQA
jgi:hypothetical protein